VDHGKQKQVHSPRAGRAPRESNSYQEENLGVMCGRLPQAREQAGNTLSDCILPSVGSMHRIHEGKARGGDKLRENERVVQPNHPT
jgi:hypothetical protein